jgi:DNA-binding NtrC family response regulator
MARVMVVDDERGVRESLRLLLADEYLVMPGRSGFDLLAELSAMPTAPPVVVLTATRTIATAVEAMKRGAVDYVTKPFEIDELRIKVRRLLERRALESEVEELRARVEEPEPVGRLLGRSRSMLDVYRTIRRVAGSRATVLLRGESGTGKELAARAIHDLGPRAEAPFVAVNCAAIPRSLIESELFGHERGAFTDARDRRIGRFEAAAGGTLFLDEIGDLERDVAAGRFRADLFYRVNVVPVDLPPLRERRGDVRLLAEHFLLQAREEAGRGPSRLGSDAVTALERHAWPGNVRELRNAVERAVALAEGEVLTLDDLPREVVRASHAASLRAAVQSGRLGLEEASAGFERDLVREALEAADWNQTRAAQQLHITRRALKLRMDRLGLKRRD